MPKIVKIEIENYRGIKSCVINLDYGQNLFCLVGRGDSGKSTVLEAIMALFAPSWNKSFSDTDFHNLNTDVPIKISAILAGDFGELAADSKYGLQMGEFDPQTQQVNFEINQLSDLEAKPMALKVRLTVNQDLEPKWQAVNERDESEIPFVAKDRASLNCFLLSDFSDRHFSWSKGNPLFSLQKANGEEGSEDHNNYVLDALRAAKSQIDSYDFPELVQVSELVADEARRYGANLDDIKSTMEIRELASKDGRLSLHDENNVPMRLRGKGSRRLASIAIQSALLNRGGIFLADEIEQGLEADRVKQVVHVLKERSNNGQVFFTTHSTHAAVEVNSSHVLVVRRGVDEHVVTSLSRGNSEQKNENAQKAVRALPEAFFADKAIVCEGATEVGICRALDRRRQRDGDSSISFKNAVYVDGGGNNMTQRALEIVDAGISVALFCDSDIEASLNPSKETCKESSVNIFDCDAGLSIEAQVFKDLPWEACKQLTLMQNSDSVISQLKNKGETVNSLDDWLSFETDDKRIMLAVISQVKDKEWFKRQDKGELLGNVIFNYYDKIPEGARLKQLVDGISNWIDE